MSLQEIFATRANRMKASEIRELLKLLDQPDIISFAGGIPDPDLFPKAAFHAPDFTRESLRTIAELEYELERR